MPKRSIPQRAGFRAEPRREVHLPGRGARGWTQGDTRGPRQREAQAPETEQTGAETEADG
jgi:hypothetical protein